VLPTGPRTSKADKGDGIESQRTCWNLEVGGAALVPMSWLAACISCSDRGYQNEIASVTVDTALVEKWGLCWPIYLTAPSFTRSHHHIPYRCLHNTQHTLTYVVPARKLSVASSSHNAPSASAAALIIAAFQSFLPQPPLLSHRQHDHASLHPALPPHHHTIRQSGRSYTRRRRSLI
jgi:hypothetical protein